MPSGPRPKRRSSFVQTREGHALALAVRTLSIALQRRTTALLKPHGVTAEQFVLLSILEAEDSITQHELARRADSDANTVRPMLFLLEKTGLIQRRNHPKDGRAKLIFLTTRGRAKIETMAAETDVCRKEMVKSIRHGSVRSLIANLHALTEALGPRP